MIDLGCYVDGCRFNKDNKCDRAYVNIDYEMTASGFYPMCQSYEESDAPSYADNDTAQGGLASAT